MTALAFPTDSLSPIDARKRVRVAVRGSGGRTLREEATCRAILYWCHEIAQLIVAYHVCRGVLALRSMRTIRREILFDCGLVAFLGTELGLHTNAGGYLVHQLERVARAYLDDPTPPALSASVRSLLYGRRIPHASSAEMLPLNRVTSIAS